MLSSPISGSGPWSCRHGAQRWGPSLPPRHPLARWLFRSLTSDGFRGNSSFLKAPLTPGLTQRFLPLHLRGGVLRGHQGLRSWGHRIASFGAFFSLNDRHPNALGVGSMADSTRWGRAQESRVPGGDSGEHQGAEGPGSREAIDIQDKGAGRGTKRGAKAGREFQRQPHARLGADQERAICFTFV